MEINLHEVVMKLAGPIMPVGETREDERRFNNLSRTIELVDLLLFDINQVVPNKNCVEGSMKKAGLKAAEFFADLKGEI